MSAPTYRQFSCAVCGGTFLTDTTEAESNAELLASGVETEGSELLSTCDDCYQVVMKKARDLGLIE